MKRRTNHKTNETVLDNIVKKLMKIMESQDYYDLMAIIGYELQKESWFEYLAIPKSVLWLSI